MEEHTVAKKPHTHHGHPHPQSASSVRIDIRDSVDQDLEALHQSVSGQRNVSVNDKSILPLSRSSDHIVNKRSKTLPERQLSLERENMLITIEKDPSTGVVAKRVICQIRDRDEQSKIIRTTLQEAINFLQKKLSIYLHLKAIDEGKVKEATHESNIKPVILKEKSSFMQTTTSTFKKLTDRMIQAGTGFKRSSNIQAFHNLLRLFTDIEMNKLPYSAYMPDDFVQLFLSAKRWGKSTLSSGLDPRKANNFNVLKLAIEKKQPISQNIAAAFCKNAHYHQVRINSAAFSFGFLALLSYPIFRYVLPAFGAKDVKDMNPFLRFLDLILLGIAMTLFASVKIYNAIKHNTDPNRIAQDDNAPNINADTDDIEQAFDAVAVARIIDPDPQAPAPSFKVHLGDIESGDGEAEDTEKAKQDSGNISQILKKPQKDPLRTPKTVSEGAKLCTYALIYEQIEKREGIFSVKTSKENEPPPEEKPIFLFCDAILGIRSEELIPTLQRVCNEKNANPLFQLIVDKVKTQLEGNKIK